MKKRNFSGDSDEEGSVWLTTYSDLMTDMLAIFVILFSFAMVAAKSTSASAATSTKNNQTAAVASAGQVIQTGQRLLSAQIKFNDFFESINSYIDKVGLSKELSVVKQGDDVILLRVADSTLFESGRADIGPKAEQLLGGISETLKKYEDSIKVIRIEGHTDNRPIHNKEFNSNWELSTTRAVNVLRRLLEISEIKPEKFSAVGYGEFHPIADNGSEAGKAQNRRVDFIIERASE